MYIVCFYFSSNLQKTHKKHFFSITSYYTGPSIKWWEDTSYEAQKSNVLSNNIKNSENTSLKVYSRNLIYVAMYKSKYTVEASSTRNMDICVVEETKIINTSQK